MKLLRYKPSSSSPETPFDKDLDSSLDKIFSELFEMLNVGLNFEDNFDCHIEEIFTDATPGVETAIAHGLKRIPVGMFVLEKDKAAHIHKGPSGKDSDNYYIVSDGSQVKATIMIF